MRRPGLGRWLVLVFVWIFMAAPISIIVVNSFNASSVSNFPPTEWSLRWYESALANPSFQEGFALSLGVAAISSLISVLAGTGAAYVFSRRQFPGSSFVLSLINAPLSTPKIAIGLAALVAYVSVTGWLAPVQVLVSGTWALAIMHAAMSLPLVVGVMLSSLEGSDRQTELAARDLGEGPVRAFFLAVLPPLAPALLVAFVFSFMVSFDELESSLFMATVSGNTLPVQMFLFLENHLDPTLAAVSTMLLAFTIVVIGLATLLGGRGLRESKAWQ